MLEAIVFDMDGVLFDSEHVISKCWYQAADEYKMPEEKREETILASIGLNHSDTKLLFEEKLGAQFPYEEFMARTVKLFHEKIDKDGLPVKEGVYEILEYLKGTDLKIGIASSSSTASIKKHLGESGITHYFEVIIGGDTVEHSKPNPDIYQNACEALGVNPVNSIAIEDSPNGIKSAYAAGMKVIMVPDMIEATAELEQLLLRKCVSLLEVKDYLIKY